MINTLSFSEKQNNVILGATIGLLGAVGALLIVLLGPVIGFGLVFGLAAGLYLLTDLSGGLYATLVIVALLPFANFPVDVGLTPTLLDGTLGGFLVVYAFQWMSGERRLFRNTPITPVVVGFTGIMLFAFLMGLRHASLTPRVMRNVVEMVLSLALIPILVDVVRDEKALRRATAVIILCGAVSAALGIVLWVMSDPLAESLLSRLGRLGYPSGGVLRYRATYGEILNERAIGTWVDPNAFGGFLLMVGAVTAPQLFAREPVLKRQVVGGALGLIGIALFLTDSRGSMLSLGAAFVFIAAIKYRKLLWIMAAIGVIALFLPPTQRYIEKLEAGFTAQDVETQMRLGEYKDAIRLIERHPVIGVGFSGTPEIDLYLGVANTYLTIASAAGFVGLAAYLILYGSVFGYSALHYRRIQAAAGISDMWLGLAAGLVGVLVGGVFDHFYFKIALFQATMVLEWTIMGLMVAATRLAVISR